MWRIKPQLLMRPTLRLMMNEELGEAMFPSRSLSVPVIQTQINKFQR